MQQYSLSLDLDANNAGALLVRDAGGAMRPASRKEILHVARELVQADELRGQALAEPAAVRDFLRLRFNAALEHEVCGLMLMDTRHRLIQYLEPFRGTLDQAAVYPREIVKLALSHNAKAIVLVHNHPNGAAEASQADIRLTQHVKQALALSTCICSITSSSPGRPSCRWPKKG